MSKPNENSGKAVPLRKQLGVDVEISVKAMQEDTEANAIIHRIGKEMGQKQPGMEYCGSVVIHIYKETQSLHKASYSLSNITNIAMLTDLSENAMLTIWQNAAIRIRSYFNPSFTHKSTDNKDKRGIVT